MRGHKAADSARTISSICGARRAGKQRRYDGKTTEQAKREIMNAFKGGQRGSRQITDCATGDIAGSSTGAPTCSIAKMREVPVPEEDLPVLLPYDVDLRGRHALKKSASLLNARCPVCGGPATGIRYHGFYVVCSSCISCVIRQQKTTMTIFREIIDRMLPATSI